MQKAASELKELREEEQILRQENIQLKVRYYFYFFSIKISKVVFFFVLQEELLQFQSEIKNLQYLKSSAGGRQHLQNRNVNITLIMGLAILFALLGIIAGKFLF